MTASLEVALIDRLTGGFPRSPIQLNAPHESDAELVRLPGGGILAVTTDGIVEEIEAGLYADPWLAGWMSVVVSASDLAAGGADPLGIMVCETLPRDASPEFIAEVQRGIAEAAAAHRLPVIGGDTNVSDRLALATTALGRVPRGRPLTRRGARAGDVLYATGPLGLGSAFAFAELRGSGGVTYRPGARLPEAALIRKWATSCMDTSDGLIPALHELGRLNGIGFDITTDVRCLLADRAWDVAVSAGLPAWTMLAGPHGEFELVFTMPEKHERSFLAAAGAAGFTPLRLGRVTPAAPLRLRSVGEELTLDAGEVRDHFERCGGDTSAFAATLPTLADRRTGG